MKNSEIPEDAVILPCSGGHNETPGTKYPGTLADTMKYLETPADTIICLRTGGSDESSAVCRFT